MSSLLTPFPKKNLRFETGLENQNDGRIGTQAKFSWRNRNWLKGAELFSVALRGGYEWQSRTKTQLNRPPAIQGGVDVSLNVPRVLIPWVNVRSVSTFMPSTRFRISYDATQRQNLYFIQSLSGAITYTFKEFIAKEHRITPIGVSYVKTDTLNANNTGINLSNLIYNGLIMGPMYEFTYNSQAERLRTHNFYINTQLELSNNILGLSQRAHYETNRRNIFGEPYAQYIKGILDARYYYKYGIHKNNVWANRAYIGIGYAYGNSTKLPNIKQFFSGGASSLRGFRSRTLGPGKYSIYNEPGGLNYVEMLGDIKLELSSEFRFNLIQFVNLAAFIDAGNIWLLNPNPQFPGGEFTSSFINDFAVSGGLGLRLDFDILVLRLDAGVPLRKPWAPDGEKWTFNSDNRPVLSIAIGYPF
jgi:outer membrane protein insertion porin family